MKKHKGKVCPKIEKKLAKYIQESYRCDEPKWNGSSQYQVKCAAWKFMVDIEKRMCVCRKWDLISEIPCPHAIAVILERQDEHENYVCDWYDVDTYLRSYDHMVHPINGQTTWPPSGMFPIQPPKWITAKRGMKKTLRRRQPDEIENARSSMMTRKGRVVMTCSICGQSGHNKQYHTKRNATTRVPAEDVQVDLFVFYSENILSCLFFDIGFVAGQVQWTTAQKGYMNEAIGQYFEAHGTYNKGLLMKICHLHNHRLSPKKDVQIFQLGIHYGTK
ncbi:Uncharacterized protein Adt_21424 [Abeliophyllum distichum]|uniref:SWIM-type domain-containing protein n=1 Tax=Abeliophyllum distichum TaxID=126358 RepID=A0ABD1SZP2_9LAMI